MDSCSALPVFTHRTLHFAVVMMLLVTSSMARPTVTSSSPQSSHLMFFLTVEKQLIPQTKDLADHAFHILETLCTDYGSLTSECMSQGKQLPAIPALDGFPSQGALRKEGSKVFTKHLMKDVHSSLYKLETLLGEEEEEDAVIAPLVAKIRTTRLQLKDELQSLYEVRLRENPGVLKKSKTRYTRLSRSGQVGDCWTQDDDCLTEDEYRLRLRYTAYTRLRKVSDVLDYAVRLSWIALQDQAWP